MNDGGEKDSLEQVNSQAAGKRQHKTRNINRNFTPPRVQDPNSGPESHSRVNTPDRQVSPARQLLDKTLNKIRQQSKPMSTNHKRGGSFRQYNSEAYYDMGVDSDLRLRLEGPITSIIMRDGRTDMVKIQIPRRVILKWSLCARDLLSGRSRDTAGADRSGGRSVHVPDWTSEPGMRWLIQWMEAKCRMNDKDERLQTRQQFEPEASTPVNGVPVLDGNHLPQIFAVLNAALALKIPDRLLEIKSFVLEETQRRPIDACEMQSFWTNIGYIEDINDFPSARILQNQVHHMLAGTPGDYEAIESYVQKHTMLASKMDALLQAKVGGTQTTSLSNAPLLQERPHNAPSQRTNRKGTE